MILIHNAQYDAEFAIRRSVEVVLEVRDPLTTTESLGARAFDIILTIVSACICWACIVQRWTAAKNWRRMNYLQWFVIAQFFLVFCFILVAGVLLYTYNDAPNMIVCNGGVIICVTLYSLIKLFYMTLADRLHIVRTSGGSRIKSKLNIFHHVAILCVVFGWNLSSFLGQKFAYITNDGSGDACIIGVGQPLAYAVMGADILLNLYLTGFFLYCLSTSFRLSITRNKMLQNAASAQTARHLSAELRSLAVRTLLGLGISMLATVVNVVIEVIMQGEVMWFCFMMCKADVLIGVCVLFWITRGDRTTMGTTAARTTDANNTGAASEPTLVSASPGVAMLQATAAAAAAASPPDIMHKTAASGKTAAFTNTMAFSSSTATSEKKPMLDSFPTPSPPRSLAALGAMEEQEDRGRRRDRDGVLAPEPGTASVVVIHGREIGGPGYRYHDDTDGDDISIGGQELLFRTEKCPEGERL